MVRVVDYAVRRNGEGEEFCALIVAGGLEILKSSTGKQYATLRKCSVPCTLNEEACQSIVGSTLPGTVKKVECDPYDYISNSGDTISLSYSWQYMEEGADDDGLDLKNILE